MSTLERPLDTPEEATQRLFRQFSSPSETLDTLTEQAEGQRVEAIAQITEVVAGGFARYFPPDEYFRSWYDFVNKQHTEAIRHAQRVNPEATLGTIMQEPDVQILSGIAYGLFRAMLQARRDRWPWQISVRHPY